MSQTWLPMDNGIDCFYNGEVRQILVDSVADKLYICGMFNQDGDCVPMRGMAQWTGSKWDSIGNATEGIAMKYGMKIFRDTLYLYGNFYNVNTKEYLAKWNGSYWDTIPGSPESVLTYAEKGDTLYMGGSFDDIWGDSIPIMEKYDGTQFSGIVPSGGLGSSGFINAMAFYQDVLYAGGYFNLLPRKALGGLGKWDGNDLQLMGPEFANNGANCNIQAMTEYQGELYIGGYFLQANGYAGNHIMKWNGTSFSDVGGGTNGRVTGMKVYNNKLYICGYFTQAGSVLSNYVAMWDGITWYSLTTDTFGGGSPTVEDINVYHDSLIIGGAFTSINGDGRMRKIAKYKYALTGIEEKINTNFLLIYPNPSESLVHIEFDLQSSAGSSLIAIKNILGQTVYSSQKNLSPGKQKLEVDVSSLPEGVYLIQLLAGSRISAARFIKQ
jgi:hypothetical protein